MKKDFQYIRYILRHKWFVFVQCVRYRIIWRGLVHDISKLLPSEWVPYRDFFYGDRVDKISVKNSFNMAWLKHIHRNSHHWQYYVLHEDDGSQVVLEMPYTDILEMVADWVGAGIAITGRIVVWDWYDKNRNNMILHSKTRDEVEALLNQLEEKYLNVEDDRPTNPDAT